MKQDIIFELINKIKSQPQLIRKAKISVAVGLVVFVIASVLVIWTGLSAVKFIATQTSELTQSPVAIEQLAKLKTEVSGLPSIKPLACWSQAQSLMAVQPWVERPVIDNLMTLKTACLEYAPTTCGGADCVNKKELINTVEGRTI